MLSKFFFCPVCNQRIKNHNINGTCPYCNSKGFKTIESLSFDDLMELRRRTCFSLKFSNERDICRNCGNFAKCNSEFWNYISNLGILFGDN